MRTIVVVMASGLVLTPMAAAAQTSGQPPTGALQVVSAQAQFQVTQMERVLGGAAEFAARQASERFRTMMPGNLLLTDRVQVWGFPIDGYGLVFNVEMPPLESTLPWILQTLNQSNIGVDTALRELQAVVEAAGTPDAHQALQLIQMRVKPASVATTAVQRDDRKSPDATTRLKGAATALTVDHPVAPGPAPDTAFNPQEVYRAEVLGALIEAMLDHSAPLRLAPSETLTVVARGRNDRPRLPGEQEPTLIRLSVRGADLAAFHARQMTREEARARVQVINIKVF